MNVTGQFSKNSNQHYGFSVIKIDLSIKHALKLKRTEKNLTLSKYFGKGVKKQLHFTIWNLFHWSFG